MLPNYHDIISRISEPPVWWDKHGVPRYKKFSPGDDHVYADISLLYVIHCQSCHKEFKVGTSSAQTDTFFSTKEFMPIEQRIKAYSDPHYGDPPIHSCVGDTMNCEDIRILEFWVRDHRRILEDLDNEHPGWQRRKDLEVELEECDL